jgi:hypothetical protein
MGKYSAKLLFQFRVKVRGFNNIRRLCEERIINFDEKSARRALIYSKKAGKNAEYNYKNNDGNLVSFEFLGIVQLICCDLVCRDGEVWYEIIEKVRPMERKASLIPPEDCLSAVKDERRKEAEKSDTPKRHTSRQRGAAVTTSASSSARKARSVR